MNSLILHIPHSSNVIPDSIRTQFVLSNQSLNTELLLMTDAYTDDLFVPENIEHKSVIFPVSRLVVDPERFIDDQLEPMSEKGMGVIYTLTSNGKKLRRSITDQERKFLIDTYYKPHHDKLNKAVENHLKKHGQSLIIDCHSFPSIPLPYEFHQSKNRPDICIGTDNFHTPEDLTQRCVQLFQEKRYSIKINKPFGGSLVPGEYYQKNKNVYSVMIEVNRELYMNEKTGDKHSGYDKLKIDLEWVLNELYNA
jgi:N-formylglutamate deformylase